MVIYPPICREKKKEEEEEEEEREEEEKGAVQRKKKLMTIKNLDSLAAPFPARGRRCHLLRPPSRSCTRRGNAQTAQPFTLDSGTTLHWLSMVALDLTSLQPVLPLERPTSRRLLAACRVYRSGGFVCNPLTPFHQQRRGPLAASADVHVGSLSLLREFRRRRWVSLETLKLCLRPLILLADPLVLPWFFSSVAIVQTEKSSPQLQALDFSSDLSLQPLLMVVAVVRGST